MIVGVAHVDPRDIELVRDIILREKPEAVAVELCKTRLEALAHRERLSFKALVRNPVGGIIAGIEEYYARKFGVRPGMEMLAAIKAAGEVGSTVLLIDQPIQVTLSKISGIPLREKARLFLDVVLAPFFARKTSLQDLRNPSFIDELVSQARNRYPELFRVLVVERDFYMASRIREALRYFSSIVAVVGRGHVEGIKKVLGLER